MLQEPAGPPDESVDVLFDEIKDQDDNTLAEYKSRGKPQLDALLTVEQTAQKAALFRLHPDMSRYNLEVPSCYSRLSMRLLLKDIQRKLSASQTIILDDDDPKALEYLLLFLYTKPEEIPYSICDNFTFEELEIRSNLVIIADKYGVSGLLSQAKDGVEYFIPRLSEIKDDAERGKTLSYIVKAVFGPEACPAFDSKKLKRAITVKACRNFKTTPSLRGDILQLMDEYAELRNRMTEVSLLEDVLRHIPVTK